MFNFGRRVNRVTFIAGSFIGFVGLLLIDVIQALIQGFNEDFLHKSSAVDTFQGVFILVSLLIFFIYILGLTRQRANDIGWHPLLVTVLVFWWPAMLLLALFKGQKSTNRFGPVPQKGVTLR